MIVKQTISSNKSVNNRIFDYSLYCKKNPTRRALLSYLTGAIINDQRGTKSLRFSNDGIAISLVKSLNEMGYTVDIIDYRDSDFVPSLKYDLVILHGALNFKKIYPRLDSSPIIHFTTGSYWKFNNQSETRRLKDFYDRTMIKIAPERIIDRHEEALNSKSIGILGIGNSFTASTYEKYPHVQMINNATYRDNKNKYRWKKFIKKNKKFIFFAGGGNIHKGLDLTIEAFNGLSEDLYIVTPLESNLTKYYRKKLVGKNIHFIDQIEIGSPMYYELMSSCSFCILPSCSEGQPGSVIDCMQAGILPIVSKECGIDKKDVFFELKDNTIISIQNAIKDAVKTNSLLLLRKSLKTRRLARTKYTPKMFVSNLKKAITKLTNP